MNADKLLVLIKQKVESDAQLEELERAFGYMNSDYFWNRKALLQRKLQNVEQQLKINNAPRELSPVEQYLITE